LKYQRSKEERVFIDPVSVDSKEIVSTKKNYYPIEMNFKELKAFTQIYNILFNALENIEENVDLSKYLKQEYKDKLDLDAFNDLSIDVLNLMEIRNLIVFCENIKDLQKSIKGGRRISINRLSLKVKHDKKSKKARMTEEKNVKKKLEIEQESKDFEENTDNYKG